VKTVIAKKKTEGLQRKRKKTQAKGGTGFKKIPKRRKLGQNGCAPNCKETKQEKYVKRRESGSTLGFAPSRKTRTHQREKGGAIQCKKKSGNLDKVEKSNRDREKPK